MKSSVIAALAISAANVAAHKFVSGPDQWAPAMGFNVVEPEEAGVEFLPLKKRDGAALAPKKQELKTRNPHIPNSKTIKIRYGPYTVPGARVYDTLSSTPTLQDSQLIIL
jgi:hypothetical protein